MGNIHGDSIRRQAKLPAPGLTLAVYQNFRNGVQTKQRQYKSRVSVQFGVHCSVFYPNFAFFNTTLAALRPLAPLIPPPAWTPLPHR